MFGPGLLKSAMLFCLTLTVAGCAGGDGDAGASLPDPGDRTTDPGDDVDGGPTQPGGANGAMVSFSTQIQPILSARCIVCHSPGGIAQLSGIPQDLGPETAYEDLVNQPSVQRPDLTLVVPGDSGSSLLFLKISSQAPPVGSPMPLTGPPLSGSEIELIRQWIDQGAERS